MKKNFKIIIPLAIMCALSALATGILTYTYLKKTTSITKQARTQAIDETKKTAEQLNRFITALEQPAKNVAALLINNRSDSSAVTQELRKKPSSITGLGSITFAADGKQATGSYYVEKDGQQQLIPITTTTSYAADPGAFFALLKNKQPHFVGPVVDPFTGKKVIVFTQASSSSTLVFATQSIDHLQHILSTLYMGKHGYWFIVDRDGTIILHPRALFTTTPTTLADLARTTDTPELADITKNKPNILAYDNEVTNQASWLIHQPIEHVGWTLCGVFELQGVRIPHEQERHHLMLITLSLLISFLLAMFIITFAFTTARAHQWALSALASCACVVSIGALWCITETYPTINQSVIPVENKVSLYTFLDSLNNTKLPARQSADATLDYYLNYRYKKDGYLPTGVFIHYMNFVSESQVNIVGYVWQRYFDGIHDGIMRGFVLPQATGEAAITEVFRSKVEKQETIIWHVNATLNQEFSYTRYPFDAREINIQLWHADFGKNIILVPDLDSYPLLTASSLPGLSANAYIPNWQFNASYFGYQKYLYNSIFGLYAYGPFGMYEHTDKSYIPELHFVATTQRLLVDTLIDDLFPLLLIALLLFVIFITDIGHGYAVFAAYASVFFGIVVSQLHFRGKIPSNQLVYFENLYFIMYLMLFITAVFTVVKLRGADRHTKWLQRGKIAELFYWPVLLSAIIVVTFIYLY